MFTLIITAHRGSGTSLTIASVPGFSNEALARMAGEKVAQQVKGECGYVVFTVCRQA